MSKRITSFIQKYVADAVLVESVGIELTYQLPDSGALDGSFERLFQELDDNKEKLGVSGYGISDTTLEEVNIYFLYFALYIVQFLFNTKVTCDLFSYM